MATADRSILVFYVNGKKIVEKNADPETSLLQYLRRTLFLTGTKLGCGEGGCGACTVMVSRYDRKQKTVRHVAVNACLAPLVSMHGLAVTTVEAIGSIRTRLHPVQERLAQSHGSQCGFCTPGFVMSMYTLLRNDPTPNREDIERALEGNLCRCTGYRPILDGFMTFAKAYSPNGCAMGDKCCKNQPSSHSPNTQKTVLAENGSAVVNGYLQENGDGTPSVNGHTPQTNKLSTNSFTPYDPTQEPIFPSELRLNDQYDKTSLRIDGERVTWYRPTSLEELLELKHTYPDAKLVTGNSEIGIEMRQKNQLYPVLIGTTQVPELSAINRDEGGIHIGAGVTLTTLNDTLLQLIQDLPEAQARFYSAIVEMLRWFAGCQIRNVAALGGNIMTASPISDLNPLLMAMKCPLVVATKGGGRRTLRVDGTFFTGYRRTAVSADEVLVSVYLPFTHKDEYIYGYKQAQRRDDDIAIVNAGLRVRFTSNTDVVEDVNLCFGGMARTTIGAQKTAAAMVGKQWTDDLLQRATDHLAEELALAPGVPGGMAAYRQTLVLSMFFKFYTTIKLNHPNILDDDAESLKKITELYHRPPTESVQVFEDVPDDQKMADPVGRPLPHLSADKQATGEAMYVDDIPAHQGELFLGLVTSSYAHARILSVDASRALQQPGVVDYIGHGDVPGSNHTGCIVKDEEIFASDKVVYHGQVVGAIVADSQEHAQRAALLVKIEYEPLKPIITIEDAIAAESYMDPMNTVKCGDVDAAFAVSDHVIEGEVKIGGQEHFYMETHVSLVLPRDEGEYEIFSSAQSLSEGQMYVALALGIPGNKVVMRAKRIGGGFGGKQSDFRLVLLPCAVAAAKLRRPVRCALDRHEDMLISGQRHPFMGKYKVGFTSEGKILGLHVDQYANGGVSLDLTGAVVEKALFNLDNCYKIPNVKSTGYCCRTNLASNTAFRAFGAPQCLLITETWLQHVADTLGKTAEQIRSINLYRQDGDSTHYGVALSNNTIRRCWNDVIATSEYAERRKQVDVYNRQNRWRKRGISVLPGKFGLSFAEKFLNQAGALVHVYNDGSVLVAHSGVEMGQGLVTKVIQVASRVLEVPVEMIHTNEATTQSVINMSPTAASTGSDINGMAVLRACEEIKARLTPYRKAKPQDTWAQWVNDAYFDRVRLSATGFYAVPDLGFDWSTQTGHPYAYYGYGAACCEVEIDTLTGDHNVLRTDIVYDVGKSLNPAIDIGQIEGAFVQGYGLYTLEDVKYSPEGVRYSRGPGMYKIPSLGNIPTTFNVTLLKESDNPKAVYSSKGIGEPPLLLAMSAFCAIKDAIYAARAEAGLHGYFRLDSPATAERIRMACPDDFTKKVPQPEPGSYTPWNIQV